MLPSDPRALVEAALAGDVRAQARLISRVEDGHPDADEILRLLFPRAGQAYVIGITGAPGAGKSTLTDQLIRHLRSKGLRVAVLAVDPSSPFTGGAILGDRIRMQDHASDPGVFIRSMGSRGHLGGVSEATPKALTILDALGADVVIIETVGVGQAEVEIVETADTTIVVVNPGWGDAIQANKAGLLEIGDIFVVNKADRPGVEDTVRDLEQMLDLGGERAWRPPIVRTVATKGEGIEELWEAIEAHRRHLTESGELERRRRARLEADLRRAVLGELQRRTAAVTGSEAFREVTEEVAARSVDPWTAARRIVDRVGGDTRGRTGDGGRGAGA